MKKLLILFLLLLTSAPPASYAWSGDELSETVVNKAMIRCVAVRATIITPLQEWVSRGSGVNIGNHYVLTAFHIYNKVVTNAHNAITPNVYVNDKPATIAFYSAEYDLLLLQCPSLDSLKTIVLGSHYRVNENVFHAGNPKGLIKLIDRGSIVKIDPEYILYNAEGLPGISGAGLYNKHGQLLGITQQIIGAEGVSYPYTGAIPLEKLQKFLINARAAGKYTQSKTPMIRNQQSISHKRCFLFTFPLRHSERTRRISHKQCLSKILLPLRRGQDDAKIGTLLCYNLQATTYHRKPSASGALVWITK